MISFIMSAYLTPNMTIYSETYEPARNSTTFTIKNTGNAAAKNVIITIQASDRITNHTVFSTENYTEGTTNNSNLVELHIPRFVQGKGSLIRIGTLIDGKLNMTSGKYGIYEYSIYVTYDQGSISASIVVPKEPLPLNAPMPLDIRVSLFWQQYGTTILYLVSFVIFVVSVWLFLKYWRNKHKLLINQIVPKRIKLKSQGNYITVLGSNFGSKGSVWLESYMPLTEEEKLDLFAPFHVDTPDKEKPELSSDLKVFFEHLEYIATYEPNRLVKQIDVTPQKVGKVEKREDNRIVSGLDRVMDELRTGRYVVRVEKGGLLSPIEPNTMFEVTSVPV